MSERIYDLELLRSQGVPPETLYFWLSFTSETNLREAYWMMRAFIDTYGVDVFWAYKDQQMMQKYGKVLTESEKKAYIEKMLADEINY